MFFLEVIKGNAFAANPSAFGLHGKDAFVQNINLQTNKQLEKLIHATLGDGKSRSEKHEAAEQIACEDGDDVVGKKLTTTKGKRKSNGAGESGTTKLRPPKPLTKQRLNQTKVTLNSISSVV